MIWVVTDHEITRDDLLRLVQARGYAAHHIDCVEDVASRAKFSRPALLIIDCGLQGSFDLVTTMRGDAFTRQIPLVMFATSNEEFRKEAMRRGADAFVPKRSLDWAELLVEVERLVGPPPGLAHPR